MQSVKAVFSICLVGKVIFFQKYVRCIDSFSALYGSFSVPAY